MILVLAGAGSMGRFHVAGSMWPVPIGPRNDSQNQFDKFELFL